MKTSGFSSRVKAAANTHNSPQKRKMLLINCAACAAPLAINAPRCVRCRTRYCNSTCQHDHWRRGHKQMCKKIHRGGNWKNCASKSEQRLSLGSDEFTQVMATLANLTMCLGMSGHPAEAREVEQTLRSSLARYGGGDMLERIQPAFPS